MALLERVNQMQQQGYSNEQISQMLQEEGISPREVSEALSQSQVKSAVNAPEAGGYAEGEEAGYAPEAGGYAEGEEAGYAPEAGGYAEGGEAYYQQALDTETVRDIANQVVEEELSKIKMELKEMSRLKTDMKFQIQNIDNRLKKIESTISQLQSDIIRKVGEYGEAISDVSNEIKATQDSFSKLVNPLIDKKRKTVSSKKPVKTTKKSNTANKTTAGFEEYFR